MPFFANSANGFVLGFLLNSSIILSLAFSHLSSQFVMTSADISDISFENLAITYSNASFSSSVNRPSLNTNKTRLTPSGTFS